MNLARWTILMNLANSYPFVNIFASCLPTIKNWSLKQRSSIFFAKCRFQTIHQFFARQYFMLYSSNNICSCPNIDKLKYSQRKRTKWWIWYLHVYAIPKLYYNTFHDVQYMIVIQNLLWYVCIWLSYCDMKSWYITQPSCIRRYSKILHKCQSADWVIAVLSWA